MMINPIRHDRIKFGIFSTLIIISLLLMTISIAYADSTINLSDDFGLTESIQVNGGIGSAFVSISDTINFIDSNPVLNSIAQIGIHVADDLGLREFATVLAQTQTIIITTIYSIITQIGNVGNGCTNSCYTNTNDLISTITTEVIFPLMLIAGTGFGFMYMGFKTFGVIVMIESFVILMLAYAQIVPSWFTLLIIIFVSAALAKLVGGLFSNGD